MLIRGWIDVYSSEDANLSDSELLEKIKLINNQTYDEYYKSYIYPDKLKSYMTGWHYPEKTVNWVSIITFGMNAQVYAYDFFKYMIENILSCSELDLNGRFFLSIEDDREEEWVIHDNQLIIN